MSARSHWISIVVFFVLGALAGAASFAQAQIAHALSLFDQLESHGLRITWPGELSDQLFIGISNDLVWLECTAAGQEQQARELALDRVRSGLAQLKFRPAPMRGPVSDLTARLHALDAATRSIRLADDGPAAEAPRRN